MKNNGMTLLEVMVSSLILVISLGSLFWILLSGKTIWQSSMQRSSSRQDLHIATWKISLELRNSRAALVTAVASSPQGFGFPSAYDSTGRFVTTQAGDPQWQKYVIYCVPSGTTRLMRRELLSGFTVPMSVSDLQNNCNGNGQLISPVITASNLVPNSSNDSALLSLATQAVNRQGGIDQQSRSMTIFFQN